MYYFSFCAILLLGTLHICLSLDPATVALLTTEAAKLAVPFTKTASERLHGEVFGTGRAARSSDIIIFNKSPKSFILASSDCTWGGFSTGLLPEYELPAGQTTIFGIESNGFLSGVTCEIKYRTRDDGKWFSVSVDNPYIGRHVIKQQSSEDISVQVTEGQGNNNQVRFIVDNETSIRINGARLTYFSNK